MSDKFVIRNARILTMEGTDYDQGCLLVEKGLIRAVGHFEIPADADVIDGTGKTIMPGLIDAHCHVGILEEIYRVEGDDLNETTDPVTPQLLALDGINPWDEAFADALRGGVTTVFIPPGSANVIGGQGVAMKTGGGSLEERLLRQPAGLKAAFGENPKRVYGNQKKMPATRMATAALLREWLGKACDYLRENKGAKEKDLKLEAVGKVLRKEMPLRIHAHRADDILTALRIAEEFGIDCVIEHCTEGHKIAGELGRRQIPAVVGPFLANRAKVELREISPRTVDTLHQAGVLVAIMTDHPVIPIQYLSLCGAIAVREGMDEAAALRALTINPARILGVEDRVGSLKAGKDADFILLDGDLFHWRTKVLATYVGGREVFSLKNLNKI